MNIYSDESDEEEKVTPGSSPRIPVVNPSSCINRLSIDMNNYEKC